MESSFFVYLSRPSALISRNISIWIQWGKVFSQCEFRGILSMSVLSLDLDMATCSSILRNFLCFWVTILSIRILLCD